jgi:superfamily II RNA helicase
MNDKIIQELQDEIARLKVKADKWEALGDKIAKCYEVDDDGEFVNDSDLVTIGELAATAYGYL